MAWLQRFPASAPSGSIELAETLARSGADAILDASPARLDRVLHLEIPIVRVRYQFEQKSGPSIFTIVEHTVSSHSS